MTLALGIQPAPQVEYSDWYIGLHLFRRYLEIAVHGFLLSVRLDNSL
jgi:hypothetical protein